MTDSPVLSSPIVLAEATEGLLLRCYQTGGGSSKGNIPDWRMFSVGKMENVLVLDEHFTQPAPGYKRNDNAMKFGIIAQL
jgi:hypothetical protein